jgi:KipI family sensor histidine kinase inhibitor
MTGDFRLLPYGDRALLVEVGDGVDVLALRDALVGAEGDPLPGVRDVVPAARTLLVEFEPGAVAEQSVRARLREASRTGSRAPAALVEVPIVYDGPDLDAVAEELGRSREAVVDMHADPEYVVAFCGFAPGFAYLSGLPRELHVPRLATPRTSVPAGAVGIAAEFTGVYPRASPGGWRLLGSTSARLWDVANDPPALLPPGTRVRFVPSRSAPAPRWTS